MTQLLSLIFAVVTRGAARQLRSQDLDIASNSVPVEKHLSLVESSGFFRESDAHWKQRKALHAKQMKVERIHHRDAARAGGKDFWQVHYEPTFHCDFSERLGAAGDGGKWVCNPSFVAEAVVAGKPCLVYSVGSRGDISFERAVAHKISKKCEVHVFDPFQGSTWSFLSYHPYALASSQGDVQKAIEGMPSKTMREIVEDLGHEGRDVDILKIDCEGCEWSTYKDWLTAGVNIRQILVELHWQHLQKDKVRQVREFFKYLFSHGYVVMSKEPNTHGCRGECIEYGFLKLSPSFAGASVDE